MLNTQQVKLMFTLENEMYTNIAVIRYPKIGNMNYGPNFKWKVSFDDKSSKMFS